MEQNKRVKAGNTKEIMSQIETRIGEGLSRQEIFRELQGEYDARDWKKLARFVGQMPEQHQREQFKGRNYVLIGLMVLFTVTKIISMVIISSNLGVNPLPLVAFGVIINVFLIMEMIRFRGHIYPLASLFVLVSILKSLQSLAGLSGTGLIVSVLLILIQAVFVFLSFKMGKDVFPNYGLFGPKKDAAGNFLV